MTLRTRLFFGVSCLTMFLAAAVAGAAGPTVFSTKSFDQAQSEAKSTGKLFIAEAVAEWSGPSARMDNKTWTDEKVVAWINERAIAARFDVDADEARAQTLEVNTVPTIILYKAGRELDRTSGFKKPEQLIEWLNAALKGVREFDKLNAVNADRAGDDGVVDILARYQLAQSYARSGQIDLAIAEYLWLWDNMLKFNPALEGVRLQYMTADMQRLANQSPPAMAAFTALRNRYQPAVNDGSTSPDQVNDWISLNMVINKDSATLQWFDRIKNDSRQAQVRDEINYRMIDLLLSQGRWAEAGRIARVPANMARSLTQTLHVNDVWETSVNGVGNARAVAMNADDAAVQSDSDKTLRWICRHQISKLYACCLAAGREDAAQGVANVLFKTMNDAQSRLMLVELCVQARQARPQHRQLLDEAVAIGGSSGANIQILRQKLEKALGNVTTKAQAAG